MSEYWLDSEAVDLLKGYLIYHEANIANDINDFGNLKPIFESFFDREPHSSDTAGG